MFGTLQKRLPQELRVAGITTMEAASRFLENVYLPRHNAAFARTPEDAGSAFVPFAGLLADILCVQEGRVVGNDNTVRYQNRVLQIPADRHRHHYVKATVRVHEYSEGTLAVFHGPRPLARSWTNPINRQRETLRCCPACGLMDNATALPISPQAPQPQQKRSIHLVPNADSSDCYRHFRAVAL